MGESSDHMVESVTFNYHSGSTLTNVAKPEQDNVLVLIKVESDGITAATTLSAVANHSEKGNELDVTNSVVKQSGS